MTKIEIVAGLRFMKASDFAGHAAFDLFADELADINVAPPELFAAWHFFRVGWEHRASGKRAVDREVDRALQENRQREQDRPPEVWHADYRAGYAHAFVLFLSKRGCNTPAELHAASPALLTEARRYAYGAANLVAAALVPDGP